MQINRRHALTALVSGIAASAVPRSATALPVGPEASGPRSLRLGNGFRVHYIPNDSGYVATTLVLRSKEIVHNGLAHICEHTSCVGAAGDMSAKEVARMNKDYVQDGNASTEAGMLKWHASFLPQYLPQVVNLLATAALDQKFDLETVAAQQRVVLEELYLDKYDPDRVAQCKFDRELFGASHPYVKETLPEEIARCKIPPAKLAAELRDFSSSVRLPANMDLFLVGSVEPDAVAKLTNEHFGRYAFAEGPRLEIPHVAVTRAYKGLTEPSYELQRPMSDLKIAWNTGVCVANAEARVLLALGEHLNTALFDELREKDGDTYTPEVSFEPDACSGIFTISISSSKDPQRVEKRVFDVIDKMKSDIDGKELVRLRDRIELKRRKDKHKNEAQLEGLVERTLHGAAVDDLAVETVTREEMLGAARKYMPSHRQAYVRLALKGQ
jgi:predicted Zn-dependent peptidase